MSDEQATPPEVASPPKKDWRGGRRTGKRKPNVLLRAYRLVFETDPPKVKKDKDAEPPKIKLIRDIKEKNPNQFIAKLQELEADHRAARGEDGDSAAMDTGSRKVLDLVDQLLKDLQAK